MSDTALVGKLEADLETVVKGRGPVHGQDRRQLFVAHGELLAHVRLLGSEDDRSLGHFDADALGDRLGGLSDDVHVDAAVANHERLELLLVVAFEEAHSAGFQARLQFLVDAVNDDDGLFRGADHSVVERLSEDDRPARLLDVGGLINEDGSVSGSNSDGWMAGAVGCLDHGWSSSGEDQVDIVMVHHGTAEGEGRILDALDPSKRSARGDAGIVAHAHGFGCALGSARVRQEDSDVARLGQEEGLGDSRRGWVGAWRDAYD
mmetsp:Transcript_26524/g.74222  ORF Transcript_26524/g.74222 Transcript_26524/m.74222 type:complete len:262 (-) Transcript_26524:178-963(-)